MVDSLNANLVSSFPCCSSWWTAGFSCRLLVFHMWWQLVHLKRQVKRASTCLSCQQINTAAPDLALAALAGCPPGSIPPSSTLQRWLPHFKIKARAPNQTHKSVYSIWGMFSWKLTSRFSEVVEWTSELSGQVSVGGRHQPRIHSWGLKYPKHKRWWRRETLTRSPSQKVF